MRTRKLLAAVLLAAPLALFATPAVASTAPPSIPISSLPNCGALEQADTGGWENRLYVSRRTGGGAFLKPTFVTLREPCMSNSTTVAVPFTAITDARTGTASDLALSPAIGYSRGLFECVTTTGTVVKYQSNPSSFLHPMGNFVTDQYVQYGTNTAATVPSGCVSIVSLEYSVRYYYGDTVATTQYLQAKAKWVAADYLNETPYAGKPVPPELVQICLDNPDFVACAEYREKDAASWSDTCADSANSSYYGVEWPGLFPDVLGGGFDVGAWLTWHAACLFVPHPDFGGFDRNYLIADALEMSPNAALFTTFDQLGAPFAAGGTCGSIVQGDVPFIGEINIDSCEWTWAHPVRSVLGIGVALMFGWWAAVFSINSILSLFSKGQKPVTPVLA